MTTNTINPENWNIAYRDYLVRFALQRVSDYGSAEDLVQETFLSAWNAKERFRGDCTERTWLTGILRNKIIDLYRKTGRRPSVLATDLEFRSSDSEETVSWMDQQADPKRTNQPEAETEKQEFLHDLENAVTNLPSKMGKAFSMRELQGLSTEEITEELNISKANLWVLIHRAKQNLSNELSAEWDEVEEFGQRRAA
ncbi:MAG: sigma-70 family RNA polymerase sigma factor [Verrucomicrobiales bacterium]|nr:sigma-70 family RNA polymerase sigma factor [Verrucomicrobiales bacterium]